MSQIIYMVVRQKDDGTTDMRTGGGSSTPKAVHAYPKLETARRYIEGMPKHYIKVIDLDALENTL